MCLPHLQRDAEDTENFANPSKRAQEELDLPAV